MLAFYAFSFGSYASNLLQLTSNKVVDSHIYATAIIILATAINDYSIVVVVGVYGLFSNPHLEQLSPKHWKTPFKLLTVGMVIFVA